MVTQQQSDYYRIAEAIEYIQAHFAEQPDLETVAAHIHLSPFHFQRLFTEWAGVSPKKFLQYITLTHARQLLRDAKTNLLDAALHTGLSGTSRLHDLFVSIEGMTPGEYKAGGASLVINYSFAETPFGNVLVASTTKGVCHLAFADGETNALVVLQEKFPHATYHHKSDRFQQVALKIFSQNWNELPTVKLHLKGSPFQLKVWETLLKIPGGALSTYGQIAASIQQPNAARAVGTAIGSNPIAFLIPCHRVIQTSGAIGGYMWGPTRKTAIIGWEAAQLSLQTSSASYEPAD